MLISSCRTGFARGGTGEATLAKRGTTESRGERPARLRVRLLGGVEIILDGRRLEAFASVRLQRFLALIALRTGPQPRSQIAFTLWPESTENQARTNLRKLLHEFRQALPDAGRFVEIEHRSVRWIQAGPSEVDVLEFRAAIANGNFEIAANTYSGDLLPACYDDWILDEREKLRSEALGVMTRLADDAAERGDHRSAAKNAQRVLDLEPTDESAVRLQMESHAALGDATAALRSYHRYAEALKRELGTAPGDEVQAIYQRLRAGSTESDRAHADRDLPTESPFVGREREWDLLDSAWNGVLDRGPHFVLVSGEAGIGKSRLASEFGGRIRADGHAVASIRSYEAAGRLPWGPVVELLRTEDIRGIIETLDATWKSELAHLLPELAGATAPSEPTASGEVAQRYRLFDAISNAVNDGRPRLLVIDDLQWCDAETIELIGFLVRSLTDAPILIVGTARPEEVSETHPLNAVLDALGRDGALTTVPLERLDESTTTKLASRIRNEDTIDPALSARLWRETEGNPLYIIEALRAGITSESEFGALTPTIRAVLHARLGQLSEASRRVADVAAVVGRPFSVDLIASATGFPPDDLVDSIDELWRRRIIRDHGPSYDFSHDKLRTAALEMVSPARRRQIHRSVAEAIERQLGENADAAAAQIAAHYDQAGMVRPAIDAYREAGARAVAVSAPDEAIAMFQRALSLLADLPGTPDRDQLELEIRIALGSPLVAVEGYGSRNSHQLYERALSLCRKLRRPVDAPILRGLGLARLQGCRFTDCDDLARSLLEREDVDAIAATEGRYLSGVSAFWQGDFASSRRYLERAIEERDDSRLREHLTFYAQDPSAICLVRLAWLELWEGDASKADGMVQEALKTARDIEHDMTQAYVITYGAIVAAESEDFPRLEQLLADGDRLWTRFSDTYLAVVLEALRGWMAVRDGTVNRIESIVDAVASCRAEGESLHLTYFLLLLARARGTIGEFGPGLAATHEALEWTRDHDQRYLESELWRVNGELQFQSGEPESAAASLRNAVEVAQMQSARWLELRALNSLLSRFPDRRTTKRLRDLLKTIPTRQDLPAFRASAELLS